MIDNIYVCEKIWRGANASPNPMLDRIWWGMTDVNIHRKNSIYTVNREYICIEFWYGVLKCSTVSVLRLVIPKIIYTKYFDKKIIYSLRPKINDSHFFLGRPKISESFSFMAFSLLLFFFTLLTLLLYSFFTLLTKPHFLKSCAEKFVLIYLGTDGVRYSIINHDVEMQRKNT